MTFSIVAKDDATGQLGVATATHAFGVGIVANYARAGVGAIATQSFIEISYGPNGLDLLEMGVAPEQALAALVSADPDRDIRQVAVVGSSGDVAHHTGARCVPSCGSVVAGGAVAAGNMLDNDRVLPAMVDAFGSAEGEFAERLITALKAGDKAGGDVRGRMSTSLKIVAAEAAPHPWEGTLYDLRIDVAADPFEALSTSLRMTKAYHAFFTHVFAPGMVTGTEPLEGEALEAALADLQAAQRDLGPDLEATVWQGVLLLRAGQVERGRELIAQGVASRPQFARFIDGLAHVGIISMTADEILRTAGHD